MKRKNAYDVTEDFSFLINHTDINKTPSVTTDRMSFFLIKKKKKERKIECLLFW